LPEILFFKYVLEFTPKIHLDLTICLSRDGELNRMSDRGNVVLLECGYDARFGSAEDGPMEWSRPFPDG